MFPLRYKPKKYNTSLYEYIKTLLGPTFTAYNNRRNSDENWKALYKKVKDLETNYDPGLDVQQNDVIAMSGILLLHSEA